MHFLQSLRTGAAALTLLLAGCTQAFFQPHSVLVSTPDRFGLEYEPVELQAEDGTALFAWFLPARGEARTTVLFLHGNAENISTHFANVAWMPAAGFNVLALDYRGYGRSGGSPSLKGAQMDIDAAMQALLARPDVDPQRIVVFGQSLGAALAVHYVAHSPRRKNVRAVVLDSPFSDYRLITREKMAGYFITWPFQWLPALTVDNDYSPQASVRAVSPIPLLLIHGEQDEVVPVEHSKRLYAGAMEPKDLWVLPNAGHIQAVRSESVRKRLTEFLLSHTKTGDTAQLRQ
jgi:uncharacterized protein